MSGSKFALEQLSKHGWKEGSGLGKSESGIKEAIKVKLKQDTHGVGHKKGDEFAFHWWDHVFNKAASNISVNTTKDGVELSKSKDTKQISTTTTKTFDNKAMLYGKFLKAATLSNGNYEAMNEQDDDSEEEEDGDDITPRIQDMEDAELLKACGGMTGHKAARHGHKLNGKLARIEEQEALLLAKYRTGKPKVKESKTDKDRHLNGQDVDDTVMTDSAKDRKKKDKSERRKRKREKEGSVSLDMEEESKYTEKIQGDEMSAQEGVNLKKKKKKDKKDKSERKECKSDKKLDTNMSETELVNGDKTQKSEEISEEDTKIKKKRKKDKQMKNLESCDNNGDSCNDTVTNNNDILDNIATKKRKKSKKQKKEKI